MTFKKGQSGNPAGRRKERPFAEALRMEIRAAGDDKKKLRLIARTLLDKAESGDMQAITVVADRLDGKPAQESEHTIRQISAAELSDDELASIIREERGNGADTSPVDPKQLN